MNRDLMKVIFSIIAIGAAGYFIYHSATKKQPGAVSDITVFRCMNCQHQFDVKTDDVSKLQKENPANDNLIKCQRCNEFKATVPIQCRFCGKYYLDQESVTKWGERGRCIHPGCEKSMREMPMQPEKQ